tara:strand:+ start:41471 stop:42745 length:1275 start_codon:yes stop_codon:yes gene_type:complete
MRLITLVILAALSVNSYGNQNETVIKYETPGEVSSADHLPAVLQTGPNHTVSSTAESDGFQNTYTISSKFGEFDATGIAALKSRIAEVDAMAYLEAVSKADVFVSALKDAGVETATAIAGVFTSPVKTVQGIPGGVERVFAGARRGFGLTKRIFQSKPDSNEIEPKDFREMNYLVGNSERNWASELKTDPYTTNMKLREMVSSMSVVEFIGGLPVDIALPMGAGLAVGVLGDETEIYRQSAQLLEAKNRACLDELGVKNGDIDAFINASYLTPTTQTAVCNALARLEGVDNLEKLPAMFAGSQSFEASNFLLHTINLLAWYNTDVSDVAAIAEIVTDDGLPYSLTDEGTVLVMLPADNLLWTDLVESRMNDIKSNGEKSIWILGSASPTASGELTKSGWKVKTTENTDQLKTLYQAETKRPESE